MYTSDVFRPLFVIRYLNGVFTSFPKLWASVEEQQIRQTDNDTVSNEHWGGKNWKNFACKFDVK